MAIEPMSSADVLPCYCDTGPRRATILAANSAALPAKGPLDSVAATECRIPSLASENAGQSSVNGRRPEGIE